MVTATRTATGAAADKPAFWIDGNIHAAELTASTACLHYLQQLADGYGHDPDITRLLDRLAELHDHEGTLAVVTVSQDRAPQGSVVAFLNRLQLPRLSSFHDPEMKLSAALGAEVLPTTILYDAQGREVWRYTGDLDWTGEEAARLLAEGRAAEAAQPR